MSVLASAAASGWPLAAGTLIGAAMLNKPTVGILLPLLLLQMLWLGIPARKTFAHALAMTVGLLAAILTAAGAVLLTGASAKDLIDNVYTFNIYTQFMDAPVSETGAGLHDLVRIAGSGTLELGALLGSLPPCSGFFAPATVPSRPPHPSSSGFAVRSHAWFSPEDGPTT